MKSEGWEVVSIQQGLANANVIVGRLEAEGIPARLQYEAVAALYGLTLDGLGQVKVLVPLEDAALAREVLEQHYHEDDLDWESNE